MSKIAIKGTVSNGLFSREVVITLRSRDGEITVYTDASNLNEKKEALYVTRVKDEGDFSKVILPNNAIETGNVFADIPNTELITA